MALTEGRIRLAAFLAVALLAVVLYFWGGDGLRDPDRIEAFLTESGLVGPVVFVLVMWLVQPFGVPGLVFMVPAAIVWPWPVAFGLSWIGNMGASLIAFAFARWVGRDWVQQRIPAGVVRWNERLAVSGVRSVAALRVVTGQLPPADWFLGVSHVSLRAFLIGTAIGIIPGILVAVLVGGSLWDLIADRPGLILALALGGAAVVVARRLRRLRRRRRRVSSPPASR
jgi:uncharacterized membrane protein YdjX (TVP38/TMEM64 family)